MTGRGVEEIPILSAAGVRAAGFALALAVLPNPEPAVRLVAPAAVVAIPGMVMAPSPQG